jgi:hypothetical protein
VLFSKIILPRGQIGVRNAIKAGRVTVLGSPSGRTT